MKKLLFATALAGFITLGAADVMAHDAKSKEKEKEAAVIKASYVLPKEDGDSFRQTLHEADEENLNINQKISLDHADLYDMLTAENFDRNAFLAKLQELRKLQDQAKENRDDAFSSAVSELSQDERQKFAVALESNPKFMGTTTHHHHKKTPPSTSSNDDQIQNASPASGSDASQ